MKVLLIVASLIAYSQAYSFKIQADVNNPGVCIYNGKILQVGENQISNKCQIAHCYEDGSIYVEGCGKVDKTEKRVIDQLMNRAYPECCKEVILEQEHVQGVIPSLDDQIYHQKGYYSQMKLNQGLNYQRDYQQGKYADRYLPQLYQQSVYAQRHLPLGYQQVEDLQQYYPLGYKQGEYSQRFNPLGIYQQGKYSQRYYPQGQQQVEDLKHYYSQRYQQIEDLERYNTLGHQQIEDLERYNTLGYQQGKYNQRYYPQTYNQELYRSDITRDQDYSSEYRQRNPLSFWQGRQNLLDMYRR